MPAAQGLRQALSGTGVTFRMSGASTATLAMVSVQESVEVSERAPVFAALYRAAPRYSADDHGHPEVIEQQGATSLTDVLRNVPGLTITAGEGGTPAGDNLTLRGNSARNDIFVDGVRDLSPQSRDPFNLESGRSHQGPDVGGLRPRLGGRRHQPDQQGAEPEPDHWRLPRAWAMRTRAAPRST